MANKKNEKKEKMVRISAKEYSKLLEAEALLESMEAQEFGTFGEFDTPELDDKTKADIAKKVEAKMI